MAAPTSAAPSGGATSARNDVIKLVCFYWQGQEYGVDIADVVETMLVKPVTRVFLTPAWMSGIMNLRGDVVAVLDLALLLGMGATVITDDSRIVLAECDQVRAGLLVDGLAELRLLDTTTRESPPSTIPPEVGSLLAGIYTLDNGQVVRALDLPALFASERLQSLDGLR